jgi:hypothetical protein
MKKIYIKPEVAVQTFKISETICAACATGTGHGTISCLLKSSPDDYDVLTNLYGLSGDTSLDSDAFNSLVFGINRQCNVACYQNPYDSFFSS